jgi:hypothetical protein
MLISSTCSLELTIDETNPFQIVYDPTEALKSDDNRTLGADYEEHNMYLGHLGHYCWTMVRDDGSHVNNNRPSIVPAGGTREPIYAYVFEVSIRLWPCEYGFRRCRRVPATRYYLRCLDFRCLMPGSREEHPCLIRLVALCHTSYGSCCVPWHKRICIVS